MPEAEILALVRKESHAFDEKIRKRDRREVFAAALVFLAFGAMAVLSSSWLVRGGAALIMAGSVFIWWTLRRARPRPHEQSAPRSVAGELRAERDALDTQIGLLESVLWWYIAPLTTGGILVTLGQGRALWSTYTMVAVWVGLGGVVWWLNQRAVRNELRPKRERLTRLLQQIEE